MVMQIIFGAVFASIARSKKLSESQIKCVGRNTAGRTLLYGGVAFAAIGAPILLFPSIDAFALQTDVTIPNLDSVGVSTFLVLLVVGGIGIGSLAAGMRRMLKTKKCEM